LQGPPDELPHRTFAPESAERPWYDPAVRRGCPRQREGRSTMPVRALLHYALEVPDQTVGETFYRTFGLVDRPARDDAVHLHPGGLGRGCTLLYGGPRKRLHHLAFGAPGGELDAVRESMRRSA